MKRSDIYPPGTEEDAINLKPMPKVMGLPVLVWAFLIVLCIGAVGVYSDIVGFYDFAEDIIEREHDENGDKTHDNGDRERKAKTSGKKKNDD